MSAGRSSTWFGGPTRPPSLVGVALAALLALGGCSGAAGETTISTSTLPSSPTTEATTNSPQGSTSVTTTTTSITTPPPDQDVIAAWSSYWQAWADVRASEDLDPGPLEAVASAAVADGAIALFERQRLSGQGAIETDVMLHATVVSADVDTATVADCVLLRPSFTDTVGVWHEADLVRTDRGWIVDVVRIPSLAGCVPKEMADGAIAGYQAYYEAEAVFWDPPDPVNPLIDGVLADPQKEFLVGLLGEHRARGVALRGQPTTHPEVIEVRSPTEVVVLSCSEPDPDYGLYDMETGERLPDEPSVREGQRDLQSAVMVLEDGLWKVSDLQGQVDFACEFAPTDRGLPSV